LHFTRLVNRYKFNFQRAIGINSVKLLPVLEGKGGLVRAGVEKNKIMEVWATVSR
jgi:hypothetical protein